jgi:ABC-type transport system involved in cytochrome bd biosynthesis fused ATPase/permease subunit
MRRSASAAERRLWEERPRARRILDAATALSLSAVVSWIAFALLLSAVIARAFIDGRTLASVDGLIVGMAVLLVARGAFLWSGEVVAQRAADGVKIVLRERLAAALVALGPS